MNQERNGIAHWTIRPVGLSDRVGRAPFFADAVTGATGSVEPGHDFSERYFQAPRVETTVELSTIDAEVEGGARPPEFMKVDVEGHELAVFQGGARTLRVHRPVLLFEATANQGRVAALLNEFGYDMFDLTGRPVASPTYSTMAFPRGQGVPKAGGAR